MGKEKEDKMWSFTNKGGDKGICLIPEVTGIIQEQWNESWKKIYKKPYKLFYVSRCYRYDRPQKGRYREFTQLGIEILGKTDESVVEYSKSVLKKCMDALEIPYEFVDGVERGVSYYSDNGFEVECPSLGAQKQVAGGGKYPEGVGWAIGVDRAMLVKKEI